MFTLPRTLATLTSKNDRSEKHGEDDVPAVSGGIKIRKDPSILDTLSPDLRDTLYETLKQLPGTGVTYRLRCKGIDHVVGSGTLEGWVLVVEHGIEDESAVVLKSCKLDKWCVYPISDTEVELTFRFGTSNVDQRILGLLGMKVGQPVHIKITPPKTLPDKASEKAEAKAAKQQKAAEAAGQKRIDDAGAVTPESALAASVGGDAGAPKVH